MINNDNHSELTSEALQGKPEDGWTEAKRIFHEVGLGMMAFAILYVVIFYMVKLPASWWFDDQADRLWYQWYSKITASLIVYLPGFIATACVMKKIPLSKPTGTMKFGPAQFIAAFSMTYGVGFFVRIFGNLLLQMIGLIPTSTSSSSSSEEETAIRVFLLLYTLIVPVICEELIYRRLLLGRLLFLGESFAILISAVFFALMHAQFSMFLHTFVAGIVFGYVYVRTGKFRYPVLLHMVNNAVTTFASYLPYQIYAAAAFFMMFGTLIIAVIVLVKYKPWKDLTPGSESGLNGTQKLTASLSSVTFWIAILMGVGILVWIRVRYGL